MTTVRADTTSTSASRFFLPALAAIAAVAVVMAVAGRAGRDLSVDEPFTALALAKGWTGIRSTAIHDNIPFYYVLLKLWTTVFGRSAWGLRSLSLAAYALAIVVTGFAGRRLAGATGGLTAAWLVATSGRIGLIHAATTRQYALVSLVAAAALLCHLIEFDDRDRSRSRRRWNAAAIIALHTAGLFTHAIYLFFALACSGLSLILLPRSRRLLVAALPLASIAIYGIAWSSVVLATFGLPITSWMVRPGLADLVAGYLTIWGAWSGCFVAGAAIALLLSRRDAVGVVSDRAWLFAAGVAVIVLGGAFAASWIKPVYLSGRTPILVIPAIAVVLATVLARLGTRRLTLAVSAVLFLPAMDFALEGIRQPDPTPTAASVATIGHEVTCGDRALAAGLSIAPVSYFAAQTGWPTCVVIEGFPAEMNDHPGWFDSASIVAQHDALLAAAKTLGASLDSGARLWVFATDRGIGAEATRLLDEVPGLILERRIPEKGAFFDHVRVYRRRGGL